VLHYCKFCNGVVLYASENDPALAERGFYDHGRYPFVFDPLFMEEDSPAGFGYIDVMKECQTAIDRMNHAMDENVLLSARQRYVLSDTAGVNEEELTDLSRDIIHVAGRLNDDSFRPMQTAGLQGNSLSYRNSRIEELKEISGNRDMTQGGTAGGVTAASAIAALQEAGSKLSRDMLKSAYRAFAKECYLIIELMPQFYDEERIFRITGKGGESEFVRFSGEVLRARPAKVVGGVELGSREPVFDIVVSAEKKSTFSRLSQNETAKECVPPPGRSAWAGQAVPALPAGPSAGPSGPASVPAAGRRVPFCRTRWRDLLNCPRRSIYLPVAASAASALAGDKKPS